jgi:hypothetical protein
VNSIALVADLTAAVTDIQRLSGHARALLHGRPMGAPKTGTAVVHIADVMTNLLHIRALATEAIAEIEAAARAAGARERKARG